MTQRKGLLLVTMEPPAPLEEEFNDWYESEHAPQRKAIAGIETARRFTCLSGWQRYLALYYLASPGVVESDAYRAISSSHESPWSQRLLAKVVGYDRTVAEQVYPGDALIGHYQQILQLILLRFTRLAAEQEEFVVKRLRGIFDRQTGLAQLLVFKSPQPQGTDFLGLAELRVPANEAIISLEAPEGSGLYPDLVNIYTPYWRRRERN